MPFTQTIMPRFRDADADGLIGIRGYMRAFQDIHTWYMHALGKGNDVLPETYGAAWVYTRCLVVLERKLDYTGPAEVCAWIDPKRSAARTLVNGEIRQKGEVMALGRIESCVIHLARRVPLRLQAVDFPPDLAEDIPNSIPAFCLLGNPDLEGMEPRYTRQVRYSDLDKSMHMTNLRYIEMFQDAWDSAFWAAFQPRRMEIRFLSQCMEGENLTVLGRADSDTVSMAAQHPDGTVAALAAFSRS